MKKETKKIRQGLQNAYISRLSKEVSKRGGNTNSTIKPIKDEYELNKKLIRSYENQIPKTVKKKIKDKVYK